MFYIREGIWTSYRQMRCDLMSCNFSGFTIFRTLEVGLHCRWCYFLVDNIFHEWEDIFVASFSLTWSCADWRVLAGLTALWIAGLVVIVVILVWLITLFWKNSSIRRYLVKIQFFIIFFHFFFRASQISI